jgi:hypothetical protein
MRDFRFEIRHWRNQILAALPLKWGDLALWQQKFASGLSSSLLTGNSNDCSAEKIIIKYRFLAQLFQVNS